MMRVVVIASCYLLRREKKPSPNNMKKRSLREPVFKWEMMSLVWCLLSEIHKFIFLNCFFLEVFFLEVFEVSIFGEKCKNFVLFSGYEHKAVPAGDIFSFNFD